MLVGGKEFSEVASLIDLLMSARQGISFSDAMEMTNAELLKMCKIVTKHNNDHNKRMKNHA